MEIRIDEMVVSIAASLDVIEGELLGASTNHGRRIGVLCAKMGKDYFNMDDEQLTLLASAAMLHDNALTEYILSEGMGEMVGESLRLHCVLGERNVKLLPFGHKIKNFILYHHEHADGTGPLHKKEGEFPLEAELIAIADNVDAENHLAQLDKKGLPGLHRTIRSRIDNQYTERAANALCGVLDEQLLDLLTDENIYETSSHIISNLTMKVTNKEIVDMASFVAKIIDYKSEFTRNHSEQIANRMWLMCAHYGFDESVCAKAYLAAGVHDLGKLTTPIEILEKPGKLSDDEFKIIKDHVSKTNELLSCIGGFEEICEWASNHHEKLDGTGYPMGKTAGELDTISRILSIADIYQAVSEKRPYHKQRTHAETMKIVYDMANKNLIDIKIAEDFDKVMAVYSLKDVPTPSL